MSAPGSAHLAQPLNTTEVDVTPATSFPYARLYTSLCGPGLVHDSWVATYCLPQPHQAPLSSAACPRGHPDLANDALFLDCRGHWMYWGQQGGG